MYPLSSARSRNMRYSVSASSLSHMALRHCGQLLTLVALFLNIAPAWASELEQVRLQLKWRHQFQFAGYYAAVEQGYFAAEGLNVELLEGKPGLDPARQVLTGNAEFAVDAPSVLIRRQQGEPLVALAAIFQHSPTVLMTVKDKGFRTPHDLHGKRIMLTPATDPECLAMIVNEGGRQDMLQIQDHSWNVDDLLQGRTDAMSVYLTNEPFIMRERDISVHIIKPGDYGIDFYGDCLVASEQMVREHPARVDAFLRAMQKGWRYAMNNPEHMAQLIHSRYSQDKTLNHLLFEAQAMQSLILPDFVEIGHMNTARWKHIADTYVQLGMMKPGYDLSGFVYSEYKEEQRIKKQALVDRGLIVLGVAFLLGAIIAANLMYFNYRLSRLVRVRTAELEASERSFRAFFEMASVGVAQIHTETGVYRRVNQKFCSMIGYSAEELLGMTYRELTYPDDLHVTGNQMQDLIAGKIREYTIEKRYVRKDGSYFWGIVTISPLWNPGQPTETHLAVIRDITARKIAEEKLLLASIVFENTVEGIVVTDDKANIEQVNPGFSIITGYSAEEVVGSNPRILKSDRHPQVFYDDMWRQLLLTGRWVGEIWNRRKNGEAYPELLTISAVRNPAGDITNYVSIFHDITELRRQQDALAYQAQHDALTGLPNRTLFSDRLQMALAQLQRHGGKLALMFLDLDNFKTINDGLGHGAGDSLLVELARRLGGQLRSGDTLARLGGDEFLVLLPEIDHIDDAGNIASRLLDTLRDQFQHGDVDYFATASIGVTVAPDDGSEPDKLIKNADMAMYQAKSLGRNNYQFFTPEMDVSAHRRISMESKLRKAIEREEFELHFQPLVRMGSGVIIGAEALVRWRHQGELVSPAEFIPLAEDSGLILPLGDWVLRTATRQARLWQDLGYDLAMSVNISSRQFSGQTLVSTLQDVLLHTELQAGKVYFEITESMLMGDMGRAESTLHALRAAGGKFYLDDFGTGYSSLSYLKRLPIDGLKIDRSFVRDITDDSDSRAIVAAIVSMAQTLNLNIIAEGVETEGQRALLRNMGVPYLQGYLASRPVPAEDFEQLLLRESLLEPLG